MRSGVELVKIEIYTNDGDELRLRVWAATEIETTELVSPADRVGELRANSGSWREVMDVHLPTLDEVRR